jgi:hypothetical protein
MQVGDASASGTAHLLQGQKRQKPCVEMMMEMIDDDEGCVDDGAGAMFVLCSSSVVWVCV